MKVLFLPQYGPKGGSSRYLTYNYLPYYQKAGIVCCVQPLFDDRYFEFGTLSRSNGLADIVSHAGYYAQRVFTRLLAVTSSVDFDLIVMEKQLMPYVPYGLEWLLRRGQPKIVSMFDDATHEYYRLHPNRLVRRLCAAKIPRVLRNSRCVVVWNRTLAAYAREFNSDVRLVDPSVDLSRFGPRRYRETDAGGSRAVVIGWIGTPNSFPYIRMIDDVLGRLARRYDIELHVVSSENYQSANVRVINKRWSLETEVDDLQAMDIGIMPLPDNAWTRGKCGVKALQYMAVSIPAVCSPVGINDEIVLPGVNGFSPETEHQWESALATLIEDEGLRRRQGLAGRGIVEEYHSQDRTAQRLIGILSDVADGAD